MHQRVPPATRGSQQSEASQASAISLPTFPVTSRSNIISTNLWYRKRSPLKFESEGLSFSVAAGVPEVLPDNTKTRYIRLSIGGATAVVAVPVGFILKILESYGLPSGHMPRDHLILLLLEHRFADAIEVLENSLKLPIAVADFVLESRLEDKQFVSLHAQCRLWDSEYWLKFSLPADLALTLVKLLYEATERRQNNLKVSITAAYRLAVTQLTLGAFTNVRLNDVILADATAGPGMVAVIIGERFGARARWQGGKITLLERPVKIPSNYREIWSMSTMTNPGGEPEAVDAELNDIQIKLIFELGRNELQLGDLRSLVPGYVFDLNRDPRTAVDIYAGSRRVGSGEVVQINDTLGVRITRLFNNE